MSRTIEQIIDAVLDIETEKYTNDPNDAGGPTKWGITLATLEKARGMPTTAAQVEKLTRAEAFEIYRRRYVVEPGFDEIVALNSRIGAELVDTGVNMGQPVAATFLQRALNAFNQRGALYPDIDVDGVCGPATVKALQAFLARRGEKGVKVLLRAMNAQQGVRYLEIAERRPQNEDFTFGWFDARVDIPA